MMPSQIVMATFASHGYQLLGRALQKVFCDQLTKKFNFSTDDCQTIVMGIVPWLVDLDPLPKYGKTIHEQPHATTSSCTACNTSWIGWYCATCNRRVEGDIPTNREQWRDNMTLQQMVHQMQAGEIPGDTPAIARTNMMLHIQDTDSASSGTDKCSEPSEATKRMRRKLSPNTSSSEDSQMSSSDDRQPHTSISNNSRIALARLDLDEMPDTALLEHAYKTQMIGIQQMWNSDEDVRVKCDEMTWAFKHIAKILHSSQQP